jgi:hypothetical protein
MSDLRDPARRAPQLAIVREALVIGLAAGGSTGLVVGTATFPLVGTALGGIVGVVVGAGAGLVTGLVLSVVSGWTRSPVAARAAAAITDGCLAVAAVARLGDGLSDWRGISFVAWCTSLGALFGARASNPGRARPSATQVAPDAGRYALYGAVIAGLAGGIVGLTIGIVVYPATSPFALVEGAALGTVPGAIVGASVAVVHPGRSGGRRP